MKKSEKLSSKNKTKVIFIYGPIAAGKLTVAQALAKIIPYKIVHVHMIMDFTKQIFPEHESMRRHEFQENLFFDVLGRLVEEKENIIMTMPYSKNYISKTGLSDPDFVKKLIQITEKYGGEFYPVQLLPSESEVLKRVGMSSRKKFGKLTDKKIMKKLLEREGMYDHSNFKNNLVIDNTKIKPNEVAKMIIKNFSL